MFNSTGVKEDVSLEYEYTVIILLYLYLNDYH